MAAAHLCRANGGLNAGSGKRGVWGRRMEAAATSKGDREGKVQPQLLEGHSEIPHPPGDEECLHGVCGRRAAEKEGSRETGIERGW